jgi:HlyD family secretion protein
MSKRIIPILLVVAIVGGVGYWVWATYFSPAAKAAEQLGGSGTIEAEQIAITPQTSGRILVAPPQEGATVTKGEVLYRLDPATLALTVASTKAGVDAAESNYRHVRNDSSSTRAEKDAAKAQWQQAIIAQKQAQILLGYATIAAPADGVLSNIAQNAGENASPGNTLAVISKNQDLTVTIYVPDTQIGQVKLGQKGTLTTDSTTKTYHAVVTFIATAAEFTPASIETKDQRVKLVYQVKLRVTDPDANLKPGMPADVVLEQ